MSVNSKMTALADEIRELSGTSETIGLDAMTNYVGEANTDVATEADLIEQIASALEGKAAGGEQATPEISVSSDGFVTATAGTKSSTYQLAFQPAKTITPSTASQIAVSSGYYTGGNVIVAGDANLIAENIKSGVSIFGVSGTLENSSGGSENTSTEDSLVTGEISNYTNSRISTIRQGAFALASNLQSVEFPKCTNIGASAFDYCSSLTTISFPICANIGYAAFFSCGNLTTASFPVCTTIGQNAFFSCKNLTTASFPVCTTIGSFAFSKCYNLKSLYLTGSSLCTLSNSNAFISTPIGGYSTSAGTYGSIYVPASLLTSYQTATNWTYFSSRFVGI